VHQLLNRLQESLWLCLEGGLTIEFRIHVKPVTLIKMSLNENHGRFQIGQHLPDITSKNSLKQGDALALLVFIFALERAIKTIQAKQEELKVSGKR
jgi:hypothetical protein